VQRNALRVQLCQANWNSNSFYNTQGRETPPPVLFNDTATGATTVASIDLFVPLAWQNATYFMRNAFWVRFYTFNEPLFSQCGGGLANETCSHYAILGFANDAAAAPYAPRVYIFTSVGYVAWVEPSDVNTIEYDAWNHLSIVHVYPSTLQFYWNRELLYTTTSAVSGTGAPLTGVAVVYAQLRNYNNTQNAEAYFSEPSVGQTFATRPLASATDVHIVPQSVVNVSADYHVRGALINAGELQLLSTHAVVVDSMYRGFDDDDDDDYDSVLTVELVDDSHLNRAVLNVTDGPVLGTTYVRVLKSPGYTVSANGGAYAIHRIITSADSVGNEFQLHPDSAAGVQLFYQNHSWYAFVEGDIQQPCDSVTVQLNVTRGDTTVQQTIEL
jgi:hypothetical protein